MGLIATEPSKKRKPYKTIIIPQGVINPNENSVIEIPIHLDTNSSLIVRGFSDSRSCLSVEPYYSSAAYDLSTNHYNGTEVSTSTAASTSSNERANAAFTTPVASSTQITSPPPVTTTSPTTPVTPITASPQAQTGQQRYRLPCLYQFPTAHSPICPICAQMTSKYVRPYVDCLTQATSKSLPDPLPSGLTDYYQSPCLNYLYKTRSFCNPTKSAKSDIIIGPERCPRFADENVALSKLLDEKIDKILKPILLSLARSRSDDEEREITPRSSYCSLGRKYSRERCYPRRHCYSTCPTFEDFKESRSCNRMRRSYSPEPDYETIRIKIKPSYDRMSNRRSRDHLPKDKYDKYPEREYKKSSVDAGSGRTKMKDVDSGEEVNKRRKSTRSRRASLEPAAEKFMKICPTTVSCQKRKNADLEVDSDSSELSFDFGMVAEAANHSGIDLNKKVVFGAKSSNKKTDHC